MGGRKTFLTTNLEIGITETISKTMVRARLRSVFSVTKKRSHFGPKVQILSNLLASQRNQFYAIGKTIYLFAVFMCFVCEILHSRMNTIP